MSGGERVPPGVLGDAHVWFICKHKEYTSTLCRSRGSWTVVVVRCPRATRRELRVSCDPDCGPEPPHGAHVV